MIEHFTEDIIQRIEKAMGFQLHSWQDKYLRVGFKLNPEYRKVGNSTIYAIKKLLTIKEKIDIDSTKCLRNISQLIDYQGEHKQMQQVMRPFILDINDKLTKAGFETCLNKKPMFNLEIDSVYSPTLINGETLDDADCIIVENGTLISLNPKLTMYLKRFIDQVSSRDIAIAFGENKPYYFKPEKPWESDDECIKYAAYIYENRLN